MKKYGVEIYVQSSSFKEKAKETCMERYGVEHALQSPELMKKAKQTCMERYGVESHSQLPASRLNLRLKKIKRIKESLENGYQISPNYNPDACKIIDIINEQGYNFQHAQNGGEFNIKSLGYWLDGYDEHRNIVIEIDEPEHFLNGKLKDKDIERQEEIKTELNCKFIRIRVDKNNNILDVNDEKIKGLLL